MHKRHASLFSGIGGAELAASWLGWDNVFHCEIQEFQRKILHYWFPNSISYEDITKTDFSQWRGKIDVLTGGFPCQPFSVAGKRKGAEDDRYFWTEMLRAIWEILPPWVVCENVAGLLSMVQPGQEIEMGRTDNLFQEDYIYRTEQQFTIDVICHDLECAGYKVQLVVIPACAVGAPHRRDRVWIVAHSKSTRSERELLEQQAKRKSDRQNSRIEQPDFRNFPTQSPICRRDDGFPFGVANLTIPFPRWRAKSIEALGNAWVPQVAYEIFKVIEVTEQKLKLKN